MWFADCRVWVAWIFNAPTNSVDPQFAARITDFSRLQTPSLEIQDG